MKPAQVAMACQACEVADLAAATAGMRDPAAAQAQAELVLAAALRLIAAADRLSEPSSQNELPADPLQRFAFEHPDEATADLTDWLTRSGLNPPASSG